MLKRLLIGAVSAALLTGIGAAPAHADERPCVSHREYQTIRWQYPPATQARVTDHFDTTGQLYDRWFSRDRLDAIRSYPKCREWGTGRVYVWFDNYSWDWRTRVYAIAPNRAMNWRFVG